MSTVKKQLSSMTLSGASESNVDVVNRRRPKLVELDLRRRSQTKLAIRGNEDSSNHAGTAGLNRGKTSVRHTGKRVTTAGKGTISRNFADLNHL